MDFGRYLSRDQRRGVPAREGIVFMNRRMISFGIYQVYCVCVGDVLVMVGAIDFIREKNNRTLVLMLEQGAPVRLT